MSNIEKLIAGAGLLSSIISIFVFVSGKTSLAETLKTKKPDSPEAGRSSFFGFLMIFISLISIYFFLKNYLHGLAISSDKNNFWSGNIIGIVITFGITALGILYTCMELFDKEARAKAKDINVFLLLINLVIGIFLIGFTIICFRYVNYTTDSNFLLYISASLCMMLSQVFISTKFT